MKKLFVLLSFISLCLVQQPCWGCSDFLLNNSGDSVISARTMDFDIPLEAEVMVIPRGQKCESRVSKKESLMHWKSKYGFVGTNVLHQPAFTDGLNEKGLSVATLWMEGAEYANSSDLLREKTILITDVANWILGSFATVEEVKEGLAKVVVIGMPVKEMGNLTPPLHLAIHDRNKKSIVVEFVKGEVQIHENSTHIMTNEPAFSEQIENLKKYSNMDNKSWYSMMGLPGDSSPSSRFALIYILNRFVQGSNNDREAVCNALHILNRVTMVNEEWQGGATEYQVLRDHANLIYYVTHNKNMNLRALDLKKLDLNPTAKTMKFPILNDRWFISANDELKP